MISPRYLTSLLPFFAAVFFVNSSWAFPAIKKGKESALPTILKADQIDGDRIENVLTATGNVEVSKGTSIVFADKIIYDKKGGMVRAFGHVLIKDLEVGNIRSSHGEIKDDFTSGKFFDSKLFFTDGSYLESQEIDRRTPLITVLQRPIYSLCPNPEISEDNDMAGKKRDFFSIKSRETTIDREENIMKSKGGIMRFYNVPVFYTPFIQVPLPAKKRQTGFLSPSYSKSTNLGLGIRTPFYINIAPSMDLTVTPLFGVSNGQIVVKNDFRHITTYGQYTAGLEVANNKIATTTDTTVVNRTNMAYRGNLTGIGIFDFTKNTGLDFAVNTVTDRNYLRDYHFDYLSYTLSKVNLDYIKGRDYYSAKIIKIQELEDATTQYSAPLAFPQLDSHIESKPFFFKEKFILTSNMTTIIRQDGLQYRRATVTPEAIIPFNIKGNLFSIDGKFQNDFYSLENNFKNSAPTNDYNAVETNYKPELSFNWRLPLIKKAQKNTLMIEPMANLVISSYRESFTAIPNEDSNNSELTVNNLFVSDRIYGFDRNESGKRVNYGVKSSLFNKYGEFGLTVGQGFKRNNHTQDVIIRGFNDSNKSSIVGQAMYKAKKYFEISYSFQLNESNYSNDVNQLTTSLVFDRFTLSSDYLLLRRTTQNLDQKEQINLSSMVKLTARWKATVVVAKDLQTGRVLSRSLMLYRDGCCTTFGFSVVETNQSSLVKPQKTFNLSLSFKNL